MGSSGELRLDGNLDPEDYWPDPGSASKVSSSISLLLGMEERT